MIDDSDKTANGRVISVRLFSIKKWMDAFILDRRIRNLSIDTIDYYRRQLENFEIFAGAHNVSLVPQITADLLRAYVLHLEANGHKGQSYDVVSSRYCCRRRRTPKDGSQ